MIENEAVVFARPGLGGTILLQKRIGGQFRRQRAGEPVSLSVIRRPGMEPTWGVSWTEIVDQAARPPARDTLAWYRIACFLPDEIPEGALLSRDPASQAQAVEDFRFVQQSLGPCHRNRS